MPKFVVKCRYFDMSAHGRTLVVGCPISPSYPPLTGTVWVWRQEEKDEEKGAANSSNLEVDPLFSRWGKSIQGPDYGATIGSRLSISANGNVFATSDYISRKSGSSTSVYAWPATADDDAAPTLPAADEGGNIVDNAESSAAGAATASWVQRGQALDDGNWTASCLSADGYLLAAVSDYAAAVFQYQEQDRQDNNQPRQ